ncbi:MAG: acyltransferase [Candidatus Dadabacteria bacterium]|nr:MAG: acyltransferase [Candidatus Dadabacteria bacterium]
MKEGVEIVADRYTNITYRQFDPSNATRWSMAVAGLLCLPLVLPLIVLAKLAPETGFRTASEWLSKAPFAWGVILRYQFYRWTLRACGKNVFISFGTVFYYPQVRIGDNVLIGMYNTIHHCDFGSNVMTAEGCRFLSGSRYHFFDRTDVPMARQGGALKRIVVGDDVWVGANAVVMESIGDGSVVGAGSVVVDPVPPYHVVAGNPARTIRTRA